MNLFEIIVSVNFKKWKNISAYRMTIFKDIEFFFNKVGRSTPLNHFKTIYLEVR